MNYENKEDIDTEDDEARYYLKHADKCPRCGEDD